MENIWTTRAAACFHWRTRRAACFDWTGRFGGSRHQRSIRVRFTSCIHKMSDSQPCLIFWISEVITSWKRHSYNRCFSGVNRVLSVAVSCTLADASCLGMDFCCRKVWGRDISFSDMGFCCWKASDGDNILAPGLMAWEDTCPSKTTHDVIGSKSTRPRCSY